MKKGKFEKGGREGRFEDCLKKGRANLCRLEKVNDEVGGRGVQIRGRKTHRGTGKRGNFWGWTKKKMPCGEGYSKKRGG